MFVTSGGSAAIALASFFIVALCAYTGWGVWLKLWPMLWRLRWFFVSILFIYFYLTPGYALWTGAPSWLPTMEGVVGGMHRIIILVLIVVAVQLLLLTTERGQLVSALYWLASPLKVLGFPRERLALRILLVIDAVEKIRYLLAETKRSPVIGLSKFQGIVVSVTFLFQLIVDEIESNELIYIQLDLLDPPPLQQWGFPFVFLLLMFLCG